MSGETLANGKVALHRGDMLEILPTLEANSIDSVLCDPPYHLTSIVKRFGKDGAAPAKSNGATGVYSRSSAGFMGKKWDGGDVAFQPDTWREVFRVLKPGGYLLAFSSPRTYHRMACAIEDAGFDVRDMVAWIYGSGFPKNHSISHAIDKHLGYESKVVGTKTRPDIRGRKTVSSALDGERGYIEHQIKEPTSDDAKQWDGWGTALKPALEPICFARKPLIGTVAENVLKYGTGGINIDACRIGTENTARNDTAEMGYHGGNLAAKYRTGSESGRFPANIITDGSEEVLAAFPDTAPANAGSPRKGKKGDGWGMTSTGAEYNDAGGSAARFFYTAKADVDDRLGSKHPTVKPIDLLQYFARLITPPGGVILDCFAGTGTTGEAAFREGFHAVLIEREPEYQADIRRRLSLVLGGPDERRYASIKAAGKTQDAGPLFGFVDEGHGGGWTVESAECSQMKMTGGQNHEA